ncbi:Suf-domain-containing protein [Leucogyrophana mollusca]|uniref:Suf-domain-containing protein n=1 Tax=Leucogyrophana mollusca TaxID=85980 RepID=A0ACB8BNN4_9AGAM|nr:Suf-domain-containing protein [Leucogyrophana mollusca]
MLKNDISYSGDNTELSEGVLHGLDSLNPQALTTTSQNSPSEWHMLCSELREEPHNPDGWNRLVDLAENAGDTEQIRESYKLLLETYPNTSSAQIANLNHFLRLGLFQFAEDLFKKYLKASPSVDLWKLYLSYVRRFNTTPNTCDAVIKAYEFALNHIGQDKDSGDVWNDYIQFVKGVKTTTPWEESQKTDTLRKVYHRAVQIPLENVEKLWYELEAFEINLNKIAATKILSGLSASYVRARTVLRQLQHHQRPLFPPPAQSSSARPLHYLPPTPTFNPAERALVGAWKTYFKWEESNPLGFEDKDRSTLISRIQGVYRKAVICMRYYSEIWYMAFVWTNSVGKEEDAISILKAGMKANPTSFLLHFAYAEQTEARGDLNDVIMTFDKLLDRLRIDLEALEARVNPANSSFSSDGSGHTVPANTPPPTTTGLSEARTPLNKPFLVTQSADQKPTEAEELAERRIEYGLVWIMYIRFVQRAQGIKAFRQKFAKARRDHWTPWEVYESAALMEYHCTKEDGVGVAARIFQKGLESFGDEIRFVLRYLEFLIHVNDDINARALFERVVITFPSERARPLWARWAQYEYQYGDLAAAQKLEKRIAKVYPSDPPIKRFAQRHAYLGTDAIAARDLGLAMVIRQSTALNLSGSSVPLQKQTGALLPLSSHSHIPSSQLSTSSKRCLSPNYKCFEGSAQSSDSGPPAKRARPMSSQPPRDRDRNRWAGPPSRIRFGGAAAWERERERVPLPIGRERGGGDENSPPLPSALSWFVGQLPSASSFDGPIFHVDNIMMMFQNAIIPSAASGATPPPPPLAGPSRGAGHPLPDNSPYQGPGGRGGFGY